MKRIIILATAVFLFFAGICQAHPVTPSRIDVGGRLCLILSIDWATNAGLTTIANQTITAIATNGSYDLRGWYLYSATTNPGSTAPTDNYTVRIADADGYIDGALMYQNRDANNTEIINFGNTSFGYPVIRGDLTVSWADNSVADATGKLVLVFVQD